MMQVGRIKFNDKQTVWVEDWFKKQDETRFTRGEWILINTQSSAPGLKSLDLYFSVPAEIYPKMEKILKDYITYELQENENFDMLYVHKGRGKYEFKNDVEQVEDMNEWLEKIKEIEKYFDGYGYTPNQIVAREVNNGATVVKVWAHECKIQSVENLNMFAEESHDFVAIKTSEDNGEMDIILDTELKFVYESALLDGANEIQALATAYGLDISYTPDLGGYFKCKPEYAAYFGVR